MKKNVKLAIICCVAGICVIAAVCGIIFSTKKSRTQSEFEKSKVTVGFYNLDDAQQKSFTQIVSELCEEKNIPVNFFKIEKDDDFSKQITENKINLVFAPAGYAVQKAVDAAVKNVSIPADTTSGMFTSMRQAVIQNDGTIKAIPLIFDNLEINIEISAFKMSGMERIATWNDIEQFAQIQKRELDYPVSFAGAESDFLLDLLGALGEAFDGYEEYNRAAEILKDAVAAKKDGAVFDAATVANKIFIDPDAPLPYSMYYLKQLVKKGYITTASKQLIHTDINSYIQQRVTKAFFTTLSVHRTYDVNAVSRFSTIYVPSKNEAGLRHFTTTTTYVVPLTISQNVEYIIEQLIVRTTSRYIILHRTQKINF